MIFRPISKNLPANTVLAMTIGPIISKNWFDYTNNINYIINQTGTGNIALQGCNVVSYQSPYGENNPVQWDILPVRPASGDYYGDSNWVNIVASTASSTSGTFAIQYQFLRIILVSNGTGTIGPVLVSWR